MTALQVWQRICSLSRAEQEGIFLMLRGKLHHPVMGSRTEGIAIRYEMMRRAMLKLRGVNINTRTRAVNVVWCRVIVAMRLMGEGFHYKAIAEAMGLERTSLYHYEKMWLTANSVPQFYMDEMDLNDKFNNEIDGKVN